MTPDAVSREIYEATIEFVLTHPHPDVNRFCQSLRRGAAEWHKAESKYLPAADYLHEGMSTGDQGIDRLLRLYAANKDAFKCEQSYTREDQVVGEDMLSGYGFVELIGKYGPFVSDSIRSGIGVWGPNINYPIHKHQAEEIYLIMSGSAMFKVGEQPETLKTPEEVVFVESMTPHGFKTLDQPMVLFYLWQAGDLREKSTFV